MRYVFQEIGEAVEDGDVEYVKLHMDELSHKEAVSQLGERGEFGQNIVWEAARSGNTEILEALLKKLGDSAKDLILQKANNEWSAVHAAVSSGNVEAVELVFMALKEQEIKDCILQKSKQNLLHFALSFKSRLEVVKACWNRLGSSEEKVQAIAMKHESGQTVLHRAAMSGNEDVFNLLADTVHLGARDGNFRAIEMFKLKDRDGDSLHLAAANGRNFNIFKRVWEESGDDVSLHAVQENADVLPVALEKSQMTEERNAWFVKKVVLLLDHLGDKAEDFICSALPPRRTLLYAAAKGGYEDVVKILLDRLGEFARYERGTVFHAATKAKCNNVQIFKLLVDKVSINRKALVEDKDWDGGTVLGLAARSPQSTGILELILEQLGSGAQLLTNTVRLLRIALVYQNRPGVKFLLDKLGPDQAQQAIRDSVDGCNLLHEAARGRNSDVFKMLMVALGRELCKEKISQQTTKRGNTVLHLVNTPELVKLIKRTVGGQECRRLICQQNMDGETALWVRGRSDFTNVFKEMAKCLEAEELKGEVQRRNKQGCTLLHQVVLSENVSIFRDMMETLSEESTIACFQVADNNGDTVLHHAVRSFAWKDLTDIFVRLGGEQLRILLKQRNNNNETPLHSANSVRRLVKAAGMSAEEIKGILGGGPGHEHRALHVACEMGSEFLVRLLLENGCEDDIVKPDELFLGNTALHAAAIGENVRVFKMLEDAIGEALQIDHCINWYGQTPLHFAAATTWQGRSMVEHLIKDKGADPCKPDHAGATPVHFAMRGESELLELLKTQGFDISKSNNVTKAGLTPLHYAAWNKNSGGLLEISPAECQADLEAVDNVEHLSPFLWSAKTSIDSCDSMLVDGYISARKSPLPEKEDKLFWKDGFLIPPPNFLMAYTCLKMIESSFPLTKTLVACTLVYGSKYENQQLAKRLLHDNQDRSKAHDLLVQSHAIQLAAMSSKLDSARKATLSAFLEEISTKSSEGDTRDGILSKLQKQLDSALAIALEKGADYGFIQVLVKHMQQQYRVRELLQARLCEVSHSLESFKRKYKERSSIEKSKLKDVKSLQEDVPLAYWIALLRLQMNKEEMATAASENEDEKKDSIKLATETISLVMKIIGQEDGQADAAGDPRSPVDTEYPNTVGRHTGRTALHWAVIFGEKDIVTELTRDRGCKKDVQDDFGRPAYWYALLHQDQLQLDRQAYITFVNHLKWDKYYESLYKDRDLYVDGLNAILVGAALIATVTFAGLMTPPLQYPVKSSDSTPDLKYVAIYKPGVHLFWVCISMSFFFSMTSALACVTGMLPNASAFDLLEVQRIRGLVVRAATFLVLSIVFVLLAFASAGFSELPSAIKLQANMIVTTFLGGAFCVYRVGKFGKAIYSLTPNNHVQRLIWWLKSYTNQLLLKLTAKGEADGVEHTGTSERPKPERRSYKRGSIHKHIVCSGGFSRRTYEWDDGLWESPFAEEIRPERSQPVEIVVVTNEVDESQSAEEA